MASDYNTQLQKLPSLKLKRNSSIVWDSDIDEELRYTSLKDIIPNSPTRNASNLDGNDFDSSNISIRNELVKRAASAYLQSAPIIATRNPNWFVNLVRNKAAISSCLHVYVRNPLRACFCHIFQFFANCMVGRLGGFSEAGHQRA